MNSLGNHSSFFQLPWPMSDPPLIEWKSDGHLTRIQTSCQFNSDAALVTGDGFKDIFGDLDGGSDSLFASFVELVAAYQHLCSHFQGSRMIDNWQARQPYYSSQYQANETTPIRALFGRRTRQRSRQRIFGIFATRSRQELPKRVCYKKMPG